LLTDRDIKRRLGKDIVIEPYDPNGLTPVGYDFHVGDFVYSLEKGLIGEVNGGFELPPKSTVQIMTQESLWVSGKIGGLFHSKVSLVSSGLSHISTTLDPNWIGPLLITLRNNTDRPFNIMRGQSFVTLVFFKALTPTNTPHNRPASRSDILMKTLQSQIEKGLESQTAAYVAKMQAVLGNEEAQKKFRAEVDAAKGPMFPKVTASIGRMVKRGVLKKIGEYILYAGMVALAVVNIAWGELPFTRNVSYSPEILLSSTLVELTTALLIITLRK
jgi:deoxycytidine triphosphate deaminase